ncbi:hypothetical protein HF295_07665 [Hujiaoplasma nucleasis]|uniref:Uncharacterized protein n=1 Tax=Hujiaoplasma nucleasis TaxID=2725268 RepID=A0A7L6N3I4_9MOLU|nr:hypothetical protein [Hujiaoplasma nucleasis]QLY40733.1 hypothetical protein HF295_07665 [Hujiaoplasma nucleasis]
MFNLSLTITLGYLFYSLVILIHVLIMTKKVSYLKVNGGRSKSFADQYKLSVSSTIIALLGLLYILLTQLNHAMISHWLYISITALLTLLWIFGLIMQLLGTKFEKTVMIWINLLGVLVHLNLLLLGI